MKSHAPCEALFTETRDPAGGSTAVALTSATEPPYLTMLGEDGGTGKMRQSLKDRRASVR